MLDPKTAKLAMKIINAHKWQPSDVFSSAIAEMKKAAEIVAANTPGPDNELTTFLVTYTDGTSYVTDMAPGVTIAEAYQYLTQAPHVSEDPVTGKETRRYVQSVEKIVKGGE